jgi:phosphopantothenoylcysteine decarboxylase/phosphopantothenate--cysteine ligase
MVLQGRKILIGITGGIAAYKVPQLLRALVRQGADVRVVMTRSAHQFVAAPTLEVLSRHPVHTDLFSRSEEFPVLHVGLAAWPDLVLIVPATANVLGKLAAGIADDLLTALMLGTRATVMAAPSMEERMLLHPAVQRNIEYLGGLGYRWLEPEEGELASGGTGKGRLPDPEAIARQVVEVLAGGQDLRGLRLLVTAGPTLEDIDPVRFISNRSTGRMGYALAQRGRERGADVVLVSGPTTLAPPAGVELVPVRTALQMQAAAEAAFDRSDAAVLAAAVSDYRIAVPSAEKLKRGAAGLSLELVENPDIAADLGARKRRDQTLVVFALESEPGLERAREKMVRKGADLAVLNNLREEGAGFAVDTNVVTLIDPQGRSEALPKMSKLDVADRVLDRVRDLRASRAGG